MILDASEVLMKECPSRTIKIRTGCGSIYVTVVRDSVTREQITVFANLGKAGGCAAAQTETTCRVCTLAVENGGKMLDVARTMKGIGCNNPTMSASSCSDAIAKAIQMDEDAENGGVPL